MNTVFISTNALIIGFAVIVVLLLIILIAVLRRPGNRGASASAPVLFAAAPAYEGFSSVNGQVVAAIAAAVAMMGQDEGRRLVVRSVRRSGGWADAGCQDALY
jgi:hypothetical protein